MRFHFADLENNFYVSRMSLYIGATNKGALGISVGSVNHVTK